jgi:hypothetical protein
MAHYTYFGLAQRMVRISNCTVILLQNTWREANMISLWVLVIQ